MAALGVVAVVVSCVDLDSLSAGGERPIDAGEDGGDAALPDPCAHARPPGPPAPEPTDDGGADLPEFELALAELKLDPTTTPGFDLDGVCTCDGREGTALAGRSSCARPANAVTDCDLDGGVDNAVAALERDNLPPNTSLANQSNRTIATGARTLLLSVSGYNGRANDDAVVVGALLGVDVQAGCPDAGDAGGWAPGRCADDTWLVAPESVVFTGAQRRLPVAIATGYVRDRQLVVTFKGSVVRVPFNDAHDIPFSNPVFSLGLVPLGVDLSPRDPGGAPGPAEKRLWAVEDGVVAGAIAGGDVLVLLGSIQTAGGRFCTLPAYDTVRDQACRTFDLGTGQGTATEPPRCDALSGAARLRLVPARAGDAGTTRPTFTGCDARKAQGGFTCP